VSEIGDWGSGIGKPNYAIIHSPDFTREYTKTCAHKKRGNLKRRLCISFYYLIPAEAPLLARAVAPPRRRPQCG